MRTISPDQVCSRILAENIWWTKAGRAEHPFSNLKPRLYLDLLYPLLYGPSPRRAVVLLGPRRVGKTVLLHHAIHRLLSQGVDPKTICYISVDHPLYNGLTLEELLDAASTASGKDFRRLASFVFFDEIQYLRDWQRHLKVLVDSYPALKCIASGSAAAALQLASKESGAGRFTDFLLPPLTFHEYLELLGKGDLVSVSNHKITSPNIAALNDEFIKYINYGGYPEVIFSEHIRVDPGRFIKNDIIDKVLLRDLPGLYGIRDIQELNYLFTTLAFNTANEVSLEELSKHSGVAKNTIKRYIEYLEAAFLVKVLHRIDHQARRFQRANFFKIYLINPSMRAALFAPINEKDQAIGALVETAILSQWFHSDTPLAYARWNSGEVDLVYLAEEDQKAFWAVEVKWTDRPASDARELSSLFSFCEKNDLEHSLVTTRTIAESKAYGDLTIEFMPAALYCFTLGYNIVAGKKEEYARRPKRLGRKKRKTAKERARSGPRRSS